MAAENRDRPSDWSAESVEDLATLMRTLPDQLVSIQLDLQPFCHGEAALPEHVRAALADACERLNQAVHAVVAMASKMNAER